MGSRVEIDFMDLNSRPQCSEMVKQQTKACGMKWPFSLSELPSQQENTFFQDYNCYPKVPSNSTQNNKYNLATKESLYLGGTFPLVTKTSTCDPRNVDQSRQTETLTIFYMGEVHIFEDITPEKAELILDLASKSTNLNMNEILEEVNYKEKAEENKSEPSSTINEFTNFAKGALAMARRATLARFLEKRKHRLNQTRPYEYGEKTSRFAFDMNQEEETASSSVHWEQLDS